MMQEPKLFLCLPVLNESANIPSLFEGISKQSYQKFELIVCVNQPEAWWNDPEKRNICLDNQKSIALIQKENRFPITLIDKSSKENAWQGKQKGVGWARKLVMDKASELGQPSDLIVSIDADSEYPADYLASVVSLFQNKPNCVGLANPYYHRLTNDDDANRAILRYEIYMRNYAINMLLIDNPYQFSALGSALATPISVYNRVGGMTPKAAGEDFYFLQKLRKFGDLENWNSTKVFPAARFSDRVNFGTGPAMIKGQAGDWSSYPIYPFQLFKKIKATYDLFPELFKSDVNTPMTHFLQNQLKKEVLWNSLRSNYKTQDQFVKACRILVDGLRILQFLKSESINNKDDQSKHLTENLLYFSTLDSEFSEQLKRDAGAIDLSSFSTLKKIRETLSNFEYSLRKSKSKP
ncbi:MAG: glycosyltransferase family 2 protein [Bacteroidales bacterium]|nr:glycosyltransferase family 2 protein [Bacteroidales bacterium]